MTPAQAANLANIAANNILRDLGAKPPRFSEKTRRILASLAAQLQALAAAALNNDPSAAEEILYLLSHSAGLTPDSNAETAANTILHDLKAKPPRFSKKTREILASLAAQLQALAAARNNDQSAAEELYYLLNHSSGDTPDFNEAIEVSEQGRSHDDGMSIS